ncbi:MAG: Uncharacterized protein G01um1014106_590 [Parcubacteria group bacterium Gr01-1014_106]|nr:MAG: Uncharacterized protein G01um1014106_590 [Parcubacteria group bacterium Gr01-1014_106]
MTVPLVTLVPFFIAVGVCAWWRPRFVIVLPLIAHAAYLLRSRVVFGAIDIPTTLLELLLGAAVITGIVHWRARILSELRALPRSVLVSVGVFLCVATISAFIAPHPRTAWGHWKAFVIEPIAYAAVLLPLLRVKEGRMLVVRALLWGGIVSAAASLIAVALCPLFPVHCPLTADFGRLRGIYDVPNSLALVLAPLTVFAGVLAFDSSSPFHLHRFARRALVLFVPALLFTQSFGGLLSAGIASFIFLRKKVKSTFPLVGVVLVVGLFFLWSTGRITHVFAESSPLRARAQIWATSAELIRDHPFLGTGLGTFEPAYQAKLHELLAKGAENREQGTETLFTVPCCLFPPLEWVVRDPHNVLLSFWLNTGLLGLLSMGALVIFALYRADPRSPTPYTRAAQSALITLLVFGLVDVPYMKNDLTVLWWVYSVLVFSGYSRRGADLAPEDSQAPG